MENLSLKQPIFKILFLLLTVIDLHSASIKNTTCDDLPPKCQYISYRRTTLGKNSSKTDNQDGILCDNVFDSQMLNGLKRAWSNCPSLQKSVVTFTIKPSRKRTIVDESFDVFKIGEYIDKFQKRYTLHFWHVDGFDIESLIYVRYASGLAFNSEFNLYKNARLVTNCSREFNTSRGFIFQPAKNDSKGMFFPYFDITKPKSVHPVCPMFFHLARIQIFRLAYLVDSYYFKNTLAFDNQTTHILINSTISALFVSKSYGLNIDSRFLNSYVFAKTQLFRFLCRLNSIQTDVFKPFSELRQIVFDSDSLIQLIRKQGIEWIRNINSDVNVNLKVVRAVNSNKNRIVRIVIEPNLNYLLNDNSQYAYDEDFCLFSRFPFNQMIFITFFEDTEFYTSRNRSRFSCTELWLLQFFRVVSYFLSDNDYKTLNSSNFTSCHFDKRLEMCNRSKSNKTDEVSANRFAYFDLMLIFELILIILSPLLGVYEMVTNIIVIYVILHKKNIKLMRRKHYLFMCLHCASNALIGLVELVNLLNECQYPVGFSCSSVRQFVPIQYLKIITGEYFNSFFRLASNFTYLGFSLSRLTLLGKDMGKFLELLNKPSILVYMIVCLIISAGLSVPKALQFDINMDWPEFAFPLPFSQNLFHFNWQFESRYMAIVIVNTIYDLVNYLLFVLLHLIVDVVLIKKLKQVLRDKEAKLKEMKSKDIEKVCKENEESERRVLSMVVFSSVLNISCKVPFMITSFNDMRLVIRKPFQMKNGYDPRFAEFDSLKMDFSFKFFCSMYKGCLLFQKFENSLYLFSMCTILHFLKHYDNNFKEAYQLVFTPVTSTPKPNSKT